jgi:hypothetical protein
MEAKLRCVLSLGQFNSELAVVVQSATGRELSLFAQKTDLEYNDTPTEAGSVIGWINVEVLDFDESVCLIKLPQTTLENGQFITVRQSQLDKVPDKKGTSARLSKLE